MSLYSIPYHAVPLKAHDMWGKHWGQLNNLQNSCPQARLTIALDRIWKMLESEHGSHERGQISSHPANLGLRRQKTPSNTIPSGPLREAPGAEVSTRPSSEKACPGCLYSINREAGTTPMYPVLVNRDIESCASVQSPKYVNKVL